MMIARGRGDFGLAAGFLAAEIVGGHAEDHQAAVMKLAPQFLQSAILRREAAERSGVDDQYRLAGEFGKPDSSLVGPGNENAYAVIRLMSGLRHGISSRTDDCDGRRACDHRCPASITNPPALDSTALSMAQPACGRRSTSRYGQLHRLTQRNDEIGAFAFRRPGRCRDRTPRSRRRCSGLPRSAPSPQARW